MTKTLRLLVLVAALTGMTLAFAASAYATPGRTQPCSNCHDGVNVPITTALVSTVGSTATYSFNSPNADSVALFDGSTKLGTFGPSGQFSVAVGKTYTLYAVTGPDTNTGLGQTSVSPVALLGKAERLAGADRFACAVEIAREYYDADPNASGTQWNTSHIVIASGEDRAAADPLAAAGVCGVYDAPLFLVSSTAVSSAVEDAVREIAAAAPGAVTVHVIGGTVSVPNARFTELQAAVGSAGTLTLDRIAGSSRYATAAEAARRVADVKGAAPQAVLVANGADPAKFYDALALSPISAAQGYPLLLVQAGGVPADTAAVLAEFEGAGGASTVIVGGGPNTVSDGVVTALNATRWSGSSRYATALAVADGAVGKGWLSRASVGVAAKMPDALAGGAAVGSKGGVLVLTETTRLSPVTAGWFDTHGAAVDECRVFGGRGSVNDSVLAALDARLP